jgi:hypothetical protein
MFRFLFTLLLLAFISAFQNTKDQKYFRCFSLFASLVCYLWFALLAIFSLLFENPKIFCFVCYSFCFCFKNQKPQKYLLFFFGFVKLLQSSLFRYSIGAWYSLYIIQATQVKSNNDDL